MRNVQDKDIPRDYLPERDVLVRVFNFEDYGFIAVATHADIGEATFAHHPSNGLEAVRALERTLQRQFALHRGQLFRLQTWRQYDNRAVRIHFANPKQAGRGLSPTEAELLDKDRIDVTLSHSRAIA